MGDEKREQKEQNSAPATPNFEELAINLGQIAEESARLQNAYLKPLSEGQAETQMPSEISDVVKTLGKVAESWLASPEKAAEAQSKLTGGLIEIWGETLKRMTGQDAKPVIEPDSRDQRFKDQAWNDIPIFDFLKQAYLHTTRWANEMVEQAQDVDPHTRHKAEFYVRQLAGAFSPSNYLATNPELLRETLEQSGKNLVRGMKMMAEDVEAGKGQLKIRQSSTANFEVGVNMATTPGKVIFRNAMIELIQYAPATEKVLRRPLLIVPPWINKFYILDLNPEKSFIRWAVSQGLTVFCLSWVNPTEEHREKGFEAYMKEGVLTAVDVIEKVTGEERITAIGYCVGGTMLAITLAYMAAVKDKRISSATFFTTQVDFTHAGDLKVFADADHVEAIEQRMEARGYLDGGKMAMAFNMLRPNDLIWPYVVNVYLKGKEPPPFDLLYWNADSTRMTQANHSFYLRNCYIGNKLAKNEMKVAGEKLKLAKVKIPIYNLAAREDHIAPARSVFVGSALFGGEVTYVLAGSGHIAGVINPPGKVKYQYWLGAEPEGDYEQWIAKASEHPGSWWPHWFEWIRAQAPEMVDARIPGKGKLKALCDAPGDYVRSKN